MERNRPCCESRHEHFWCRRFVSERRMSHDGGVVALPAFDDDLGLAQSVEDLSIEQLIAKVCIEAVDVVVLSQAAALDICGFGTNSRYPFLHGLGDELRSIVGPDVTGNTPQDEEVRQNHRWS
jgi:hypothetical protein